MQKYFLNNKIILTTLFLIMLFAFADSISAVFFNPTVTPPSSNIATSINVGPDFQTKSGLVAVNGFRVLGPTILDQSFKLTQGASNGYVLTSDANGNASWQLPSSSGGGNNGWENTTGLVYLSDYNDNLSFGNSTVVNSGNNRYIHNNGADSTFLGITSGPATSSVSANKNTGVGVNSLRSLTSGNNNTGFGYSSLYSNTTGSYNTSVGYVSMYSNNDGSRNTAYGTAALSNNISANDNTAIGGNALFNTIGNGNTAVGAGALSVNTTGTNNTAIGYDAEVSTGALTNTIAIGNGAIVDASNKIKIGNTSVTSIDLQVAYTYPSDLRLKENINDIDLGLEFIKKLRPVSYTLKGGKGIDYGFIAQEVETAIGKDTNLVLTDNTEFKGKTMRYTELIAPLTKAVLEQQKEIEEYRIRLEKLKERARILEEGLNN